jgi:hypothetical protein
MSKLIDIKIENKVYHTTLSALTEVYTLTGNALETKQCYGRDPYLLSRGLEILRVIMNQMPEEGAS